MKKVSWPYFDPEFDKLPERLYGPPCRVFIDNESLEDCTVVKVDSVKKQGLILEEVEILADLNLIICKCHISSDAGTWFMDVFHVKDKHGNKLTDVNIINYIKQAILCAASRPNSPNKTATSSAAAPPSPCADHTDAIEITAPARPSLLLSEISAALADQLGCNILEAQAWSHNPRLACVAYMISDDHGQPSAVAPPIANELNSATSTAASTTRTTPVGAESGGDRDIISCGNNNNNNNSVRIEKCKEKEYWVVSVECRDRPRLMYDTLCILTHLNYLIFHASFTSDHHGFAFQEYFIRHVDGKALISTESDKQRIIKCLEAAIQRRVCKGIRLELRAEYRAGLLSDITRVLRDNGLPVVAARGEEAVNAGFHVRHVSGNNIDQVVLVDMELVDQTMKKLEIIMSPILVDLQIITNYIIASPHEISRPSHHDLSLAHKLKSHIHSFSRNLFFNNIK